MSYLLVVVVLAGVIASALFLLSRYRPPKCPTCRDGWKLDHLPEFGVYGTSLCIHCGACDTYYVLEATSREIKTIDAKTAKRDFHPREGTAHE